MKRLKEFISAQFRKPTGLAGAVISLIQNLVNRRMYRSTVKLVPSTDSNKILDIGFGNGHLLNMLSKRQEVDLYGIDISEDALKMAMRNNKKVAEEGRLHLTNGDCSRLPYDENSFDAVTTINTVYFWQDPERCLSEIKRVLKPGKSFLNVLYSKEYLDGKSFTKFGYRKFTSEELVSFGDKVGFEWIEVRDIKPGESMAVIYTK